MFLCDRKQTSDNDSHLMNLVAPLMDRLGMHLFRSTLKQMLQKLRVESLFCKRFDIVCLARSIFTHTRAYLGSLEQVRDPLQSGAQM